MLLAFSRPLRQICWLQASYAGAAAASSPPLLRAQSHSSLCCQGVGYAPGAPGMDDSSKGIWWGENLAGAKTQPVVLADPSKLVYSPHTYGPGTFMQSYFNDGAFPSNLAALWSSRFAYLAEWSKAPVVIGEMGGWYTGKDQQWQDWAVSFMRDKGIGIFYFVLQPMSDDTGASAVPCPAQALLKPLPHIKRSRALPAIPPHQPPLMPTFILPSTSASHHHTTTTTTPRAGGLLKADWETPEDAKLRMLAQLPSTDVAELVGLPH